LFPLIDLVVAGFPLALLGYDGLYLCCFFFFSFFCLRQKSSTQGVQLGVWLSFMSLTVISWLVFQLFSSTFGAGFTQPHSFSQDTRPSAEFLVVVFSRCRKHWSRRSSESGVWLARAREPFVLWLV
jgi:hypothetical protein